MKKILKNIPSNNVFFAFLESFTLYIVIGLSISFISIKYNNSYFYELLAYILIACVILLYYLIKKDFKKLDIKTNKKNIIISFGLIILASLINLLIIHFIGRSPNDKINIAYLKDDFWINSIKIIIFAPIVEEFIFRYPYRNVKSNKIITYIIYTFIFALCHLTFESYQELIYFIPYLVLSLGIGFTYFKTNNILYSIIMHMLNNFVVILFIQLF